MPDRPVTSGGDGWFVPSLEWFPQLRRQTVEEVDAKLSILAECREEAADAIDNLLDDRIALIRRREP